MQNTESDRGEDRVQDEINLETESQMRPRDGDRRKDTASLFGGYQGPERRSGRDRRANA
jgi:hypothetical protein